MLADLSLLLPGVRRGEAARRIRGLCSVLHATSHTTCFKRTVCVRVLVCDWYVYIRVCSCSLLSAVVR